MSKRKSSVKAVFVFKDLGGREGEMGLVLVGEIG